MKIIVRFKPNTSYDYGARLIVSVPFLRTRAKNVPIRTTYFPDMQTIKMAEIFIPDRLMNEVPQFFIGELLMLSSRVVSVERA